MTEKQSILGRIAQLRATDPRALLASTSDPGAMLDQFVRDLTATIAEAEEASSVTEANLRLAGLDHAEDTKAAGAWASAAQDAWDRGDELRARDGHSDPTPFDSLAEAARTKQQAAESAIASAEQILGAQEIAAAQLKEGIAAMRSLLAEIKDGKQEFVAAASAIPGGVASTTVNVMDPESDLIRFRAELQREIATSLSEPDAAADIEEHLTSEEPEVGEAVVIESAQSPSDAPDSDEAPYPSESSEAPDPFDSDGSDAAAPVLPAEPDSSPSASSASSADSSSESAASPN